MCAETCCWLSYRRKVTARRLTVLAVSHRLALELDRALAKLTSGNSQSGIYGVSRPGLLLGAMASLMGSTRQKDAACDDIGKAGSRALLSPD